MKDNERKEIQKITKMELKNREDSLAPKSKKIYKIYKYISFIFALLLIADSYVLPLFGIKASVFINTPFLRPISIISFLVITVFSHLLSISYNPNSKITKDEWLKRTFYMFIIPWCIGFFIMIILFYFGMPSHPLKNALLGLMTISFIGFHFCVLWIMKFPSNFFNQIMTGVGTFFFNAFYHSLIQFVLLGLILPIPLSAPPFLFNEPTLSLILFFVGIILVVAVIQLDKSYFLTDDRFDTTQRFLLRFIDSKKLLDFFKISKLYKKAKVEALEIILALEKEGNEQKQKALLIYLNEKFRTKKSKTITILISIILFIIGAVVQLIIQVWLDIPIRKLFNDIF